jgi:hypothetical protein
MNAVPSIEEFHAKRAIAMASRYLEKKSDMITCTDSEIKRTSEFIRTLRELSRNDQVSEQFIDQLRFLVNKLKERKRRLLGKTSLEENRTSASAPSSSAKSIISAASLSISYNNHTSREDESSIDKIQNLLFEQKEMQSKELSSERKTQEVIISELAGLTEILKQTTLKIHLSVQRQNMQLQEMQHFAEQNDEELEKQKQKVKYPKWIEIYIASLMITCMLLE